MTGPGWCTWVVLWTRQKRCLGNPWSVLSLWSRPDPALFAWPSIHSFLKVPIGGRLGSRAPSGLASTGRSQTNSDPTYLLDDYDGRLARLAYNIYRRRKENETNDVHDDTGFEARGHVNGKIAWGHPPPGPLCSDEEQHTTSPCAFCPSWLLWDPKEFIGILLHTELRQ